MNNAVDAKHPWLFADRLLPLSIAHRGASHYAYDNSLAAFNSAELLGADFWEVDARTTADGVLVAYHDPDISAISGQKTLISETHYDELLAISMQYQQPIEALSTVLDLANKSSTGIYLDAKDATATQQAATLLQEHNIEKAVIGCFNASELQRLSEAGCKYPLAVLVPIGANPFKLAEQTGADIIHLCWEHAGIRPQDLVTAEMIEEAQRRQLAIVLWHEERQEIVSDLLKLPVLGICSNRPELLKPYTIEHQNAPALACHRGANTVCPENTLLGAHCAFGAGYQFVELDVHTSDDGELIVIHDDTLQRTTNGTGPVHEHTLQEIGLLDAGFWFSSFFQNTRVPLLTDMLELASQYDGDLYIEIKNAKVTDVVDIVNRHNMLEDCFFWSFKQHYLSEIREYSPAANIMTRRKDYATLNECIRFADAQIIEFDAKVDDLTEIDNCQQSGCKAMVAYNGTDSAMFNRILDAAPDIVNLNHPNLLRKCLNT